MMTIRAMTAEERATLCRHRESGASHIVKGIFPLWLAIPGTIVFFIAQTAGGALLSPAFSGIVPAAEFVFEWLLPVFIFVFFVGSLPLRNHFKVREINRKIDTDLEAGTIEETRVSVVAAKRFKEPEHNAYMLFLRTPKDRVFVVYDYESFGRERPKICLRPRANLSLVRFPESGLDLLDWSGPEVPVKRSKELLLHVDDWPEAEAWFDIPWDELEAVLTTPGRRSKAA